MKKKLIHVTAAVMLLAGFASCDPGDDDDDNPTPTVTYDCEGGRQAYLEMTIDGTQYAVPANTNATGGVAVVTESGAENTRLDMGMSASNGDVFNIKIVLDGVVSTGAYSPATTSNPFIVVKNVGYKIKNVTVSYDELNNRRNNDLNPDVDFYDKSSGTFSGVYEDENGDNISFTGKFCADMAPR